MQPPRLYIFAGLPGTGKTTLARLLAREVGATYLRIDTVEQALRVERVELCGPEGYGVAYRVAEDNLQLGMSVVADSVNPVAVTRRAWREVAARVGVGFVEIEVICSDVREHRRRVESRAGDIAGHRLPTWQEVESRERDPWDTTPVVIDTAGQTESESFATLRQMIFGSSMKSLTALDLRAFVPSKDFGMSKAFYEAIGFTKTWEDEGMAEFQIGNHRFFLQNYYHEGWAKNCMLNLVVEDVSAWWSHLQTAGIVDKFPGVKVSEPTPQAQGILLYLHDPSGVLWHLQQRSSGAEVADGNSETR